MSSVKELRSALANSVEQSCQEMGQGDPKRLATMVEDAVKTEGVAAMSVDDIWRIGQVSAAALACPYLKIGQLRSPQNMQAVRELSRAVMSPDYNLEIAVGLGGSEMAPSLRLPSYVLPALEIGRSLVSVGVAPRLRVFLAHEVSSAANDLDTDIAKARATQASLLIKSFAEEFYPDCAPSLSITHTSMDELRQKGLEQDKDILVRPMLPNDGNGQDTTSDALCKISARAEKHSERPSGELPEIACLYAAAHGLAFHNYRYPEVGGVIKIGGQGEAPFDVIQQYMSDVAFANGNYVANLATNSQPQTVGLRSKAGTIPPYYLEGSSELTVDSRPNDIPGNTQEIVDLYNANGLRSGSDYLQMPDAVQSRYCGYLRNYLI
jgi:hypothetical protein